MEPKEKQTTKGKILLVEDDQNMGFLLKENLKIHGYESTICYDGESGLEAFEKEKYDLCILDIMLPKKDGYNVAKGIRKINPTVPIIFLTAKSMLQDKLMGFELGGDDYITKPFSAQELILRVKAIMKRAKPGSESVQLKSKFYIGDYFFDYQNRYLHYKKEKHRLSAKEAELLKVFAQNTNKLVNRQVILKTVWGHDDYFTAKSMDVYMTKLRKLLKNDPKLKIQNVHGIGYKMIENEEEEQN